MDAYRALEERYARMAQLSCAAAVLQWDRATMMPTGGAEARAEQLATLSTLVHELCTDPALGDLLHQHFTLGERYVAILGTVDNQGGCGYCLGG